MLVEMFGGLSMFRKSSAIRLGSIVTGVLTGSLLAATVWAADTKPDFSGVWTNYRAPPPANAPAGGPGQAGAPAGGARPPRDRSGAGLPFRPEARKKVDEYRALVAENQDNPGGFCLGTGMPGAMLGSGGYPMEWIQRPEQITVVYEAHTELRRIYMDGRKIDPNDIIPSRDGFSVGHWEGDTLVVETTHLKEQVDQSMAHSDQAKVVERYKMSQDANGRKVLTAEMTMTDPVFYTEPVKQTKMWSAAKPNTMMITYECNEPAWEDHLEELRAKAAKKAASK